MLLKEPPLPPKPIFLVEAIGPSFQCFKFRPNINSRSTRFDRELKGTMSDINSYVLTGRLVSQPRLAENEYGGALFIIANNHRYRDKHGNMQQETLFLPCMAFGGWVRALGGRQKGEMLLLTGRLRSECWEQDGETGGIDRTGIVRGRCFGNSTADFELFANTGTRACRRRITDLPE